MSKNPFIIETIFPAREVHLFVGPSGVGKTRFLFQLIADWVQGKPIFGHKSYPVPFVYVSCDRSLDSVNRTLEQLGITTEIPRFSPVDMEYMETLDTILKKVESDFPESRVLFIEGIASLVDGGKVNDYHIVSRFLKRLTRLCKKNDWTIIGVGHATKTKENERYLNPRERCLGSVAWGGFSETVVMLDSVDPGNKEKFKYRNVYLLPRNAREEMYEMEFDNGILTPVQSKPEVYGQNKIKNFVYSLSQGETFTFDEAYGHATASKSYTYKVLGELEQIGVVKRIKSGLYCFTPTSSLLQ